MRKLVIVLFAMLAVGLTPLAALAKDNGPECDPNPGFRTEPNERVLGPNGFPRQGDQFIAKVYVMTAEDNSLPACEPLEFGLISKEAHFPYYDPSDNQILYDDDYISVVNPDIYTLVADVPPCYYQVDLVEGSNHEVLSSENGGQECQETPPPEHHHHKPPPSPQPKPKNEHHQTTTNGGPSGESNSTARRAQHQRTLRGETAETGFNENQQRLAVVMVCLFVFGGYMLWLDRRERRTAA